MRNTLINLNGALCGWEEAKISVFDRSFLFGDSLYEVVRTYGGRPYGISHHLNRLQKSAELCRMKLEWSLAQLESEILRTIKEHQKRLGSPQAELYCRIVISRGIGKIGFGLKNIEAGGSCVIITQPLEDFVTVDPLRGIRLKVVERLRNHPHALDPAMKSGNYLNNLLAYLEAQADGFDDALLCNAHAHVTEGTTFNIFYVKNNIVVTPPLDIGILDGITRRGILQSAQNLGLETREIRFPKERLYEADEVFATSTTKDAFAVTQVDSRTIGSKKPGPVTRRLAQSFVELAAELAEREAGSQ